MENSMDRVCRALNKIFGKQSWRNYSECSKEIKNKKFGDMKHRGKTNTYLVEFLEGDNKENMRKE